MFSETECIERREFTTLHKIVLGLVPGDLEQQLSYSTADLNTVDNNGRTAISIAAERGDLDSLSTLLRYGADVNISSTSLSSPLHFAACARNSSCIQPLLDAGALVDSLTDWKQTPLMYTAAYVKNAIPAEILLDAGADIDLRDLDGITALGWTATAGNVPVAEVLIRRGANVGNVDRRGDTFLALCVTNNQLDLLRLLRGRRITTDTSSSAKNLLVAVAYHANVETIDLLCDLSLEGVDLDARDHDYVLWLDILETRIDYDENLRRSIERLRRILQGQDEPLAVFDNGRASSDDEDDFEDAPERL